MKQYQSIKIKNNYVGLINREGGCKAHHYRTTLIYKQRKMTLDFYKGILNEGEPKLEEVLYCLFLDATARGINFEDWCYELGYDTDSRRAEDIYNKCLNLANKLNKLLKIEYSRIKEEIESLEI